MRSAFIGQVLKYTLQFLCLVWINSIGEIPPPPPSTLIQTVAKPPLHSVHGNGSLCRVPTISKQTFRWKLPGTGDRSPHRSNYSKIVYEFIFRNSIGTKLWEYTHSFTTRLFCQECFAWQRTAQTDSPGVAHCSTVFQHTVCSCHFRKETP
jgi:hypothetical protein